MTEKELHKIFSTNIKKHRANNKWTQTALAKKIGTSSNFINDLESAKKWASPVTMVKLANAFKIEVYELLRQPDLLPDNMNSILRKYTENVHTVIDHTFADFMKTNMRKIMAEKM